MKYIRTDEGIFETTNLALECYRDIKVANTIEELCDEFVYEKQGYETPQRCYQNNSDDWFDERSIRRLTEKEVLTIKGAIWTDKGLIYVAKMNDKGELELI